MSEEKIIEATGHATIDWGAFPGGKPIPAGKVVVGNISKVRVVKRNLAGEVIADITLEDGDGQHR